MLSRHTELSTFDGKRKYLPLEEQERFLVATSQLDLAEVRTFAIPWHSQGAEFQKLRRFDSRMRDQIAPEYAPAFVRSLIKSRSNSANAPIL